MSVKKNTLYNLTGTALPIGLSLLTLPLYLHAMGEARYGILAVVWVVLGYFGVFDLGMGRATAQRISALRSALPLERASALSSALALSVGFGLVGTLALFASSDVLINHLLDMDSDLQPEIAGALPWLAVALPIASVVPSLQGALQGTEKFLRLNLITLAGTFIFQLLPLSVATFWSPDLRLILPAALISRVVTMLLMLHQVRRVVVPEGFVRPTKVEAYRLLHFGSWATVTALISPLMVLLDRFLIGAIAGPQAVTYYTVPFQLAERTTVLSISLASAIFPKYANATTAERDRLTNRAFDVVCAVITPLMLCSVLFVGTFLSWWISPDFAIQAQLLGQILLFGFWANSVAVIPFTRLQAVGRADAVARCHMLELPPYLLLLWALITTHGPIGAAIAFTTRAVADLILLVATAGVARLALKATAAPASLMAIALTLSLQTEFGIISRLIAFCVLVSAAFTFSVYRNWGSVVSFAQR